MSRHHPIYRFSDDGPHMTSWRIFYQEYQNLPDHEREAKWLTEHSCPECGGWCPNCQRWKNSN